MRLSLLSDATAPAPRTTASTPGRSGEASPAATPAAPSNAPAGRRVALVIGNGAYAQVKALPNPPNDARDR